MGLLSAIGDLFQSDEDRSAGNQNALQRFAMNLNDQQDPAAQSIKMGISQGLPEGQLLANAAQSNPKYLPIYVDYLMKQKQAQAEAPKNALEMEKLRAETDKMKSPDYKTVEVNGRLIRYDERNLNAKPEVVFGTDNVDVKGEGELRKEFDNLNKDYRTVNDAYQKIQNSANDPSAAGDLALIFSYMKILDPASTVREGEFANAQNAAGVPTQIQNLWNRAKTGERLAPEQRADFLKQSKNLYNAQAQGYTAGVKKYRDLAKEYGYSPDRIVKETEQTKGKRVKFGDLPK